MRKYILFNMAFMVLFMTISAVCNAQAGNQKILITNFHVEKNQNKVQINWSTDDKVATNYFEVEKSNDGKKFKTIAYVLGADPTKTDCDCYSYSDRVANSSNEAFYRLEHVNTNGQVEFSEVKTLALK
jgi:hypothetical protein